MIEWGKKKPHFSQRMGEMGHPAMSWEMNAKIPTSRKRGEKWGTLVRFELVRLSYESGKLSSCARLDSRGRLSLHRDRLGELA
jgi:hypothetical protein